MNTKLRVVIADDERPARNFLRNLIESFDDAEIVGEASDGLEAVKVIEATKPDLALLDLNMPEVGGLEAVGMIKKDSLPLIAFVTAYDEFAIRAFEVNAVDYLLKPVERQRLRETFDRAHERLENADASANRNASRVVDVHQQTAPQPRLERIPIRRRDEILLLPVQEVASIVADGELLYITTVKGEKFTINFRLKDLAARLDPAKFVRLSRGAIVNAAMISHITLQPGNTYLVTLDNNQQLHVSRLQARIFREQFLKM